MHRLQTDSGVVIKPFDFDSFISSLTQNDSAGKTKDEDEYGWEQELIGQLTERENRVFGEEASPGKLKTSFLAELEKSM